MSKQLLTHQKIVKNNHTVAKIAVFVTIIAMMTWVFVEALCDYDVLIEALLLPASILIMIVCLVGTIKTHICAKRNDFVIYEDRLSIKTIESGDDANSYYFVFNGLKEKVSVDKKIYNNAEIGDLFYIIQFGTHKDYTLDQIYEKKNYTLDESLISKLKVRD